MIWGDRRIVIPNKELCSAAASLYNARKAQVSVSKFGLKILSVGAKRRVFFLYFVFFLMKIGREAARVFCLLIILA